MELLLAYCLVLTVKPDLFEFHVQKIDAEFPVTQGVAGAKENLADFRYLYAGHQRRGKGWITQPLLKALAFHPAAVQLPDCSVSGKLGDDLAEPAADGAMHQWKPQAVTAVGQSQPGRNRIQCIHHHLDTLEKLGGIFGA